MDVSFQVRGEYPDVRGVSHLTLRALQRFENTWVLLSLRLKGDPFHFCHAEAHWIFESNRAPKAWIITGEAKSPPELDPKGHAFKRSNHRAVESRESGRFPTPNRLWNLLRNKKTQSTTLNAASHSLTSKDILRILLFDILARTSHPSLLPPPPAASFFAPCAPSDCPFFLRCLFPASTFFTVE